MSLMTGGGGPGDPDRDRSLAQGTSPGNNSRVGEASAASRFLPAGDGETEPPERDGETEPPERDRCR
eukprot:CAMPEP_0204181256 /NCGR_PEP_ID=MMETSP0361-20130328/51737_1 /ASSEMBLY_ACC=CAM_ASM_000343 /TAXON_ID=268821 /ORGANISM="Scrippsiella Hangoei, Strain SHTV-5" /LENGTH=66 /DNA_ID=CAMNT_0051140805 /DNA_START=78 /DNA_END=275 /DNA_ORIENTATION=+